MLKILALAINKMKNTLIEEKFLSKIISELKNTSGDDFFHTMTEQLAHIIDADYTFIARLERSKWVSQTISLYAKGAIAPNFEYDLRGTPCEEVACDATYICPHDVTSYFPKDELLIQMHIDGYVGAPLYSSTGETFGIVVALYEKPIQDANFVSSLFELFSGRIAAEIERTEQQKILEELNKNLEQKVAERTQELQQSLEHLQKSQEVIIEQERLASLGRLVAGVAHEINTPLGVAILCGSSISDTLHDIESNLENKTLSKNLLINAINSIEKSTIQLNNNLDRAAYLIFNFKQVAVERDQDEYSNIAICKWLDSQLASLEPLINKANINLTVNLLIDELYLDTYPSKLSQVLVNLIQNAVVHAFPEEINNNNMQLLIEAYCQDNKFIIAVEDNGVGIEEEKHHQIFEPFYTTKRNAGGTGLGLSIVKNIIAKALEGEILIKPLPSGTRFEVLLPVKDM